MAYSNWQEGANAARAGQPITDCPYPASDWASVTWTNGWTTATHNMAKERGFDIPKEGWGTGWSNQGHKIEVVKPSTVCSVCGEPQFDSPGGVTCKNGHGGAEPLEITGPGSVKVAWGVDLVTGKPVAVSAMFVPRPDPLDDDLFGDDNSDLF